MDRNDASTEELRGSGRTTAAILECIAAALRSPDRWVKLNDPTINEVTAEPIAGLIRAEPPFGLHLDVVSLGAIVHVRSPLSRLRGGQPNPLEVGSPGDF